MEIMKSCIKCGLQKSLSEYYSHPQMGDGHLGICKSCHKAVMTQRRQNKLDEIRDYDRRRFHENPKRRAATLACAVRWNKRNPDGYRAHYLVSNAIRDRRLFRKPCIKCGATKGIHAHHEDYSKPLDVIWLCTPCHSQHHVAERNGRLE